MILHLILNFLFCHFLTMVIRGSPRWNECLSFLMYGKITVLQSEGKAGTLLLLNALDSSGAPVGCVRSDAQTQASHWLELEDTRPSRFHRCSDSLSLSPCGEKTTRKGGTEIKKHYFLFSVQISKSQRGWAESGPDTFWRGGIISRTRRAGSLLHGGARAATSFQWISIQWKYPGE